MSPLGEEILVMMSLNPVWMTTDAVLDALNATRKSKKAKKITAEQVVETLTTLVGERLLLIELWDGEARYTLSKPGREAVEAL